MDLDINGSVYLIGSDSLAVLNHFDIGLLFSLMEKQIQQDYLYTDDMMFEVLLFLYSIILDYQRSGQSELLQQISAAVNLVL